MHADYDPTTAHVDHKLRWVLDTLTRLAHDPEEPAIRWVAVESLKALTTAIAGVGTPSLRAVLR